MDQKATATATALQGVHDLAINEAALQAHVINPPHLQGVVSSRGLHEGNPQLEFHLPPGPVYHLDVKGFGDALHAALKDCVAGYVMRLRQNGTTIYTLEWNWAKLPVDGGEGWNPDVRMHIASCSKLITAIAMTRLLNNKGISYDSPIAPHLPNYWVKGPHVNQVTFRHLMTQRSGFNFGVQSSASDYGFMKSQVAAGTTHLGQYWYQNMNFGLCRILIATINGNISPGFIATDQFWDFVTIQAYKTYVNQHLFTPSGVSGPTLDHPSPDALAYEFPPITGWNSGDLSTVSGGAGWHMSPDDLLNVMGTFRRNGTIMTNAQAQTMLDDGFGIDVIMSTPLGKLYNKNGLWADGAGRTEQSLTYFLPQGMELVVLANSPICVQKTFFRDLVTNIYLANIKS